MEQSRFNPVERRPHLLKDFLRENSNSCSSSGLKSFPRKPIDPPGCSMRSLMEMESKSRNSIPRILTRSRSAKSAFQTLINAVKSISFTAVKSPSILPRSLSRRLSKRKSRKEDEMKGGEIKITVKIKDIIRWKSFRDLVEEQPQSFDFASSPHRCTTATTTTTGSTTTCSSKGSSWSDSDFTLSWDGNFGEHALNDVEADKRYSPFVGKDSVEATTGTAGYTAVVRAKEILTRKEEQESPDSVLQTGEDDFLPFNKSHANVERKSQRFMQTIQRFESLAKLDLENLEKCQENTGSEEEECDAYGNEDGGEDEEQGRIERRARQLLHCVRATSSMQFSRASLDQLLLDFFRDELNTTTNQAGHKFEREILRIAEDWTNGSFAHEIEDNNKDAYIKDMERRGRWSKFEEEQEELVREIEAAILENLVVEILENWVVFPLQ